jgi:hypothetical protein
MLVARQAERSRWARLILAATLIAYLLIALVGFRVIEPDFLSKRIAQMALPFITSETRTASVNYDEQSLIWYLREKTRRFHLRLDSAQVTDFLNQPGPALCVLNEQSVGQIHLEPGWRTFKVSGHNFARWKLRSVPLLGVQVILPLPESLNLVTIIKS